MRPIVELILTLLNFYSYVLLAAAVTSWLLAFNVVNLHNEAVRTVWNVLTNLTEPLLSRVRNYIPSFGNIDMSFLVVYLGVLLIHEEIYRYILPIVP